MKLLRTVVIKEIVTKRKKDELISEYGKKLKQCERELEQLSFQLYKATRGVESKHKREMIRSRFTEEMNKRKEKLDLLKFKIQQIEKLELGSEIRAGTAERIVEVYVGDPWPEREEEIIIKDGIINEIRESRRRDE